MSNVMNKDCEGCAFKLGHRCDCTNSICTNNSEYTINEEDNNMNLSCVNFIDNGCENCIFNVGSGCTFDDTRCINHSEYTANEEDNNMNIDKKYDMLQKAFDSAIEEINSLKKELDELKQCNSKKVENVLATYKDAFGERDECRSYWYLDGDSCPRHLETDKYIVHDTDYNPYCGYLSEDYVNIAAKFKKFNDMLLAFKWCYDREYKPTYTTDNDNDKWYIFYNGCNNTYSCDKIYNWIEPIIYFSSKKIADKCCDWLNEIDPNGELIMVS